MVLIGLDGGSRNVLDPLLRDGELPHLEELAKRGTSAALQTVEPVISPTVRTSIATGQSPELHGIKGFYHTSDQVGVPTIWERPAGRGHRVGLYDYLVTWPPLDLPGGFVIPGWLRRDASLSPPDVFSRSGLSPYQYTLLLDRPEAALETVRGEVTEKAPRFNQLASSTPSDSCALGVNPVNCRRGRRASKTRGCSPRSRAAPGHRSRRCVDPHFRDASAR